MPSTEQPKRKAAARSTLAGGFGHSVFLANLHHMCAQTDGTYRFPNSREGDMLKTAKREIEQLREALRRVFVLTGNHYGIDASGVEVECYEISRDALNEPNPELPGAKRPV